MGKYFLLIGLWYTTINCSSGQTEDSMVILMVEDNKIDLTKSLELLNSKNPKLICVNIDLECDQNEADNRLSDVLSNTPFLIMPSELQMFGSKEYRDIVGCSSFYSQGVATGFTNLISDKNVENLVDKVQIKSLYKKRVMFHFATTMASALNAEKTREFIDSHSDTIAIDFSRERKFKTYHIDDFEKKTVSTDVLHGKIVILTTFPYDYFGVRRNNKDQKLINMSTSEIFANIACQIVDE
jgi:CHASE2 domain-containing sensor protein